MTSPARFFVPLLLVTLLALPSAAFAVPTVGYPTRQSLALSKPSFAVTQTSDGRVNAIFVSKTKTLNSVGELADANQSSDGYVLRDIESTSAVAKIPKPLFAGPYYWMHSWLELNPNGTTGDLKFSSIKDFTIPVKFQSLSIGTPYQDSNRTTAGFSGKFKTNARKAKIECTVMMGSMRVARKTRSASMLSSLKNEKWSCTGMNVPESHDGHRMTFKLKLSSGGVTATKSKSFTAR